MKNSLFLILLILIPAVIPGQTPLSDFTGYKIFINPGHGGYDSDDRHILATDFWESQGNLVKGLFLRDILVKMNATVSMSRTTNTTQDDLPLSAISTMANNFNADFFLSIHSNGYDGSQNQPLMLFRGYDNQPVYPESKNMALIMWQKLFEKGNCWTSSNVWVKGDWTFYPEWGDKVGLGVLRGLTMPGVLSEGSFHDYIPESWRLRNNDFLHHESWAFTRSFIEYRNSTPLTFGLIAGTVRDPLRSPSYYFKPGTKDEALPLNGAIVTLKPGNRSYHVDNLNNGFFMFDSLSPGIYKLYFNGVTDFMSDSLQVTVNANKSTLADVLLKYDTTIVPSLLSVTPPITDSVLFNQEFIFTFDLSMNIDSVKKALIFTPSVQLGYTWEDKNKILRVKPSVKYSPKTNYSVTLSTTACSKWNVKIAVPYQFSFVTKNRSKLNLEKNYPVEGQNKVSLFPQIRLVFDAPLDPSSLIANISILNSLGQTVGKKNEQNNVTGGKSHYYFEPSIPLDLNKTYRIVLKSDLSDVSGIKLGQDKEISFTTRPSPYPSGTIIESFDDIARFWDPEASGSTTGTDNPLTTFTSSTTVKKSGTASGQLDYVFVNPDGGVCRVFNNQKPAIGNDLSKVFGVWVFGDLSYNALEYWFYSSGTTNQIVSVDTLDWAGWDLKTIPFSDIGGSGDRLFHSVVIRQTANGEKSGTIWFDEAVLMNYTGIEDISGGKDLKLFSYPNPFSEYSSVSFVLNKRCNIKLDVYTLSGQKIGNIFTGETDPGPYTFKWTPSSSVGNGIYFYRFELKEPGSLIPYIITQKCILIR
jgi:hypothetical protein